MNKKREQKIKDSIEWVLENTKDFNTLGHLYSNDEATRKIAELRENILTLKQCLKYDDIKEVKLTVDENPIFSRTEDAKLVKVRVAGQEKTYLGIYIGNSALTCNLEIKGNELLLTPAHKNPTIFVPELKKIVYGIESWWSEIDSIEDFKDITDEDIENTWYVKVFKKMNENNGND